MHASDERMGFLLLPLPRSLNYVVYHRVHHVNQNKNFGLNIITDKFYDYIFDEDTIYKEKENWHSF